MPPVAVDRWHSQMNARSRAAITLDHNRGADAARVSVHAAKTEVSRPAVDAGLLIHPASVVFDGDLDCVFPEDDAHFDDARIRMAKRIRQRLAADAIHLVAYQRIDLARRSLRAERQLRRFAETKLF